MSCHIFHTYYYPFRDIGPFNDNKPATGSHPGWLAGGSALRNCTIYMKSERFVTIAVPPRATHVSSRRQGPAWPSQHYIIIPHYVGGGRRGCG